MPTVDVSMEGVEPPGWLPQFIRFCTVALDTLDYSRWELSLTLCNDEFIRALNVRYRGKDEPTDVLSFPQYESGPPDTVIDGASDTIYAGDIILSLETLQENASYYGVDAEDELKRLVVHGILHLAGCSHSDNSPEQPMLRHQEQILQQLTEERVF